MNLDTVAAAVILTTVYVSVVLGTVLSAASVFLILTNI